MKRPLSKNNKGNSIAVLLLVLAFVAAACEDKESNRRLSVLKRFAADTAAYPGFKQVFGWESAKRGRAILSVSYNSSANYEDVKSFYSERLTANGWELYPKERRRGILYFQDDSALVFRNGEYQIGILSGSVDHDQMARNYSIVYVWEEP